jgi:hypothetical protein
VRDWTTALREVTGGKSWEFNLIVVNKLSNKEFLIHKSLIVELNELDNILGNKYLMLSNISVYYLTKEQAITNCNSY